MAYERGVRPDYTVGTITLVSGSKNFTTTGSSLQSAFIQAGDTIMTRSGLVLVIASITGQNAGTLVENAPAGAAGANQPLLIRFQPDGSRLQGAIRDLLGRWGQNGNVDAIAGLPTAKDMLAFFTGAGTADVTALTAWARTLLAAADGGAAYGVLGDVPMSALQHVHGQNGSDGWVRLSSAQKGSGAEVDTSSIGITAAGNFYLMRDGSNVAYWNTQGVQTLGTVPTDRLSGIVGNVTQSGGGAIIQRGGNANGEFVRYKDGTQFCWGKASVPSVPNEPTLQPITYPASFSVAPSTLVTPAVTSTAYIRASIGQLTTTGFDIIALRTNTTSTTHHWIAIGRWF